MSGRVGSGFGSSLMAGPRRRTCDWAQGTDHPPAWLPPPRSVAQRSHRGRALAARGSHVNMTSGLHVAPCGSHMPNRPEGPMPSAAENPYRKRLSGHCVISIIRMLAAVAGRPRTTRSCGQRRLGVLFGRAYWRAQSADAVSHRGETGLAAAKADKSSMSGSKQQQGTLAHARQPGRVSHRREQPVSFDGSAAEDAFPARRAGPPGGWPIQTGLPHQSQWLFRRLRPKADRRTSSRRTRLRPDAFAVQQPASPRADELHHE